MRWWKRTRTRKLVAGTALLATLAHVAFASLHLVMMATVALAGESGATQTGLHFVICGPARFGHGNTSAQPDGSGDDDAPADTSGTPTNFCPFCTGAVAPALLLPHTPPQPAYVALAEPVTVAPDDIAVADRYETGPRLSQGPPLSA